MKRVIAAAAVLLAITGCSVDSYDGDGARAICDSISDSQRRDLCLLEAAKRAAGCRPAHSNESDTEGD